MRRFALLTGAIVLGLAALAAVLPGTDRYVPGVDDGPPQQFTTIADAEKAAGFDFPDAGTPGGWKLQTVIVTPAYYGRRLLSERPELSERRMSIRDAVTSGRASSGSLRFWLTDGLPDPPPGVHNFVNLFYTSDNGVFISLSPNQRSPEPDSFAPISDVTDKTTKGVRIGGTPATLTTYTSPSSDAMIAAWRVKGMSITATAFNGSSNPLYRITPDEFIAFLANVR